MNPLAAAQNPHATANNPFSTVPDTKLLQMTSELAMKLRNLETSMQQGSIRPEALEKAKVAQGEWRRQVKQLANECRVRGINLNNRPMPAGGNNGNGGQDSNVGGGNSYISPIPPNNQVPPQMQQQQQQPWQQSLGQNSSPHMPPNTLSGPSPLIGSMQNNGSIGNLSAPALQQYLIGQQTSDHAQLRRQQFFQKLGEVFKSQGMTLDKLPQIEGKDVDLFLLYQGVIALGGSEQVRLYLVVPLHLSVVLTLASFHLVFSRFATRTCGLSSPPSCLAPIRATTSPARRRTLPTSSQASSRRSSRASRRPGKLRSPSSGRTCRSRLSSNSFTTCRLSSSNWPSSSSSRTNSTATGPTRSTSSRLR